MSSEPPSRKLLTYEFLALCLIIAVTFANICVFYSFYHYLADIGIPVAWRGFLVGLEPMTAFVLRLFVLPWLHLRNAFAVTMISLILLITASCAYLWATTVPAMIVLRIFHGASFVLLTSAAFALAVNFIPAEKSGQGFSVISIATMIPYTVIPSLAEHLLPYVRNEADIYAAVSIFSILAIILLLSVRGRLGQVLRGMDGVLLRRPAMSEIRANFRIPSVTILLASCFLIYCSYATPFYFLKDLSIQNHAGDVGLFFTLAMTMMITIRALGGTLLDRINKYTIMKTVLPLFIPVLILLALVSAPAAFYLLAVFYGLCMGVMLPVLLAMLFLSSPPQLRGLNTNLSLFAIDMAFFTVPYLGGMVISLGAGFDVLFFIAAGCIVVSLGLIIHLKRHIDQKS